MSAIVIPATEVDIRVTTRKMTNMPATGTYLNIEKVTSLATAVEGLYETITHVRSNSKLYRATLTLMYGHPDDIFLMAAAELQETAPVLLFFSFFHGGYKYASNTISIESMPNVEMAADGSPTRAWPLVGLFPKIILAAFQQPTQATEAQIANLIPA